MFATWITDDRITFTGSDTAVALSNTLIDLLWELLAIITLIWSAA